MHTQIIILQETVDIMYVLLISCFVLFSGKCIEGVPTLCRQALVIACFVVDVKSAHIQ